MSKLNYQKELEEIKAQITPEQKKIIEEAERAYKEYDSAMESLGYPNMIRHSRNSSVSQLPKESHAIRRDRI